jgi:23S rRNA pseudouridine1911/1915/1917 synthase
MKSGKKQARKPGRSRVSTMRRVNVVHDDDDIIVADKPAGLLTIGTDRERQRTLYRQLSDSERRRHRGSRVFVVHRLDRDTSGLLVFAKSEKAKRMLQAQFHDRLAGRTYHAVVRGPNPRDEDLLKSYLAENRAMRTYITTDPRRGKLAITRVRVLCRVPAATLLEVILESGRKHQIRVQLAATGHPLLGDRRYGEDRAGPIGRLALHAVVLEFDHPATGERVRFESRVPQNFLTPFPKRGKSRLE